MRASFYELMLYGKTGIERNHLTAYEKMFARAMFRKKQQPKEKSETEKPGEDLTGEKNT